MSEKKCCLDCIHRFAIMLPGEVWIRCRKTNRKFICKYECENCPAKDCPYFELER